MSGPPLGTDGPPRAHRPSFPGPGPRWLARRSKPWSALGLSIALAALLVVPTLPVAPAGLPVASSGTGNGAVDLSALAGTLTGAGGTATALGGTHQPRSAPQPAERAGPSAALPCPAMIAGWLSLYSHGLIPPAVSGTDTPSCVPGADDVGLSLVSNQSYSGSRPEVTVQLPDLSSYDAGSLASFWIGVAVSGPPCSLDGQAILRIQLTPPTNPYGSGPQSSWQVRAPIWDLVSPGSCDPACQNASALFSIDGARFCEDDAVVFGDNARGGAPVALLETADSFRIEVGGGGASPLIVYLNDTTHLADSAAWTYPASDLVGGAEAQAWSPSASSRTGWTFGGSVSVGWTSCPVVNGSSLGVACNSYAGAPLRAVSYPKVTNTSFWNPGRHAFDAQYSAFETYSSSGACSGDLGVTTCSDFQGYGGAGAYPSVSLYASGGSAWVGYGSNATGLVRPIGNASRGLDPHGSSTFVHPSVITQLSADVTANEINLSARATDPRGIYQVVFGALWCFNGASTTPVYYEFNGFEGPGPLNGSEDGYFNYTGIPRGSNLTGGTLYYWARVDSSASGPTGPPVFGQVPVIGGPQSCQPLTPAPPAPLSASPVASGYHVLWGYPSVGEVRNFSILATPVGGGPTTVLSIPDREARSATILLRPNANYTLTFGTTTLDGVTSKLPIGLAGITTLPMLSASYSVSATELWQPGATENVTVQLSGGRAPYCALVDWGDGQSIPTCGPTTTLNASHPYGGFFGAARIRLTANDSVGDLASANDTLLNLRATPLGVRVTVFAGDGLVNLNWTAPRSPSANVTGYVVYFSSDPVASNDLTWGWPDNVSGPHPVYIRNTSATSLNDFAVPDSSTFYVEVVAWDSYGAGLVSSGGPSVGRPAPLTVTFSPAPSGGSAPYSTNLYAIVTSGSPNALTSAVFFSGTSPGVPASVTTIGGTSWVNGSYTFPYPGLTRITVHIVDALSEANAATTSLYVGPGIAPLIDLNVLTPTPYENQPVAFEATISLGTGPYNYSWDFGDGALAYDTVARPSHTYALPGEYTVTATVTDNSTGSSTTLSSSFVVYALPTVAISSATGSSGGLSYTFHAVVSGGSGPSKIAWSFGDGSGAEGPNSSHVYGTVGVYTVSVTATDPTGLHASASVEVYAGVARTSVPFLGGSSGVTLVILLVGAVVVLGGLSIYFYAKARRTRVIEGEPMEETYGSERPPPPPTGAEPSPDASEGPAEPNS